MPKQATTRRKRVKTPPAALLDGGFAFGKKKDPADLYKVKTVEQPVAEKKRGLLSTLKAKGEAMYQTHQNNKAIKAFRKENPRNNWDPNTNLLAYKPNTDSQSNPDTKTDAPAEDPDTKTEATSVRTASDYDDATATTDPEATAKDPEGEITASDFEDATATDAPAPAAADNPEIPPEEQGGDMKKYGQGINQLFNMLYKIVGLICVLVIMGIFVLVLVDVITYYTREAKQAAEIQFKNPNQYKFLTDSTDFKIVSYDTVTPAEEPYLVYTGQALVSVMSMLIALLLVSIFAHILLFLMIKLMKVWNNQPFEESFSIDPLYMQVIVVAVLGSFVMNIVHAQEFEKKVRPGFQAILQKHRHLRDFMYNNMTTHVGFLTALNDDNVGAAQEYIERETSPTSLKKLIYTFNLYNYFTNIPDAYDEHAAVMKMFEPGASKTREVNPIWFLKYKENTFVENTFPSFRKLALSEAQLRIAQRDVTSMMTRTNKDMISMQSTDDAKNKFKNYLWTRFGVGASLIVALVVVFRREIADIFQKLGPLVKELWAKLKEFMQKMSGQG